MIGRDQSPAIGAATQFQPGQSGNPAGLTPGSKNLSTVIRELMESPPDWSKINIKNIEALKERYKNSTTGEALVYVAVSKAVAGDVPAMRWLSKTGYGDKVTFDGELKHQGMIIYRPKQYPEEEPTNTQPTAPASEQSAPPPPAPNPDLDGIA